MQNQIENYTALGSIHLAKARIEKNRKYNVTTQHKDQHPNHPELNLGGWMMQRKFSLGEMPNLY